MGRVKNEILYYIEHPEELSEDYFEYWENREYRVEDNPQKDNLPINDNDLPF